MADFKRIAILTSGGDAPGMNAAIRAAARAAIANGFEVYGILRGWNGLMYGEYKEIKMRTVSNIIHRGGTVLYSARSKEFCTEEGMQKAIDFCKANEIGGVIVIGGDGSFRGARDLSERGINCVGIPGTIDNDIACTDYTIGYDTCLNTIVEMVDRIRDTSESHDRCTVVEVMGRGAGYLALNSGIAVGAAAILIPEVEFNLQKDVIDRINKTRSESDKRHFVVIVAEGCSAKLREQGIDGVSGLARYIEHETGVESRDTTLGHVQRGGSPSAKDRMAGSEMGAYATHLLLNNIGNRVIGYQKGEIVDYDIVEALNMKKTINKELYKTAVEIAI